MPTSKQERQRAFEKMYRIVEAAKHDADPDTAKVMDYMVQVTERVGTEAERREPHAFYYSSFATHLAEMVAKVAKRWIS